MKNSSFFRAACMVALFTPLCSIAQTSVTGPIFTDGPGYRRFSIGVNGGLLAPVAPTGGSNDFTKWKAQAGYGAYVKYQILHSLGIQANYTGGKLAGNNDRKLGNDKTPDREVNSFETSLKWSAGLSAVVNVATINWMYKKNAVQIYVSAGGGLAGYSPKISSQVEGGNMIEYKNDGIIKEFYVPIGAGLKFKLSESVNLDLGYTMHYVDGDNLDGYNYGPDRDKFSYGYAGLEFPLGKRTKPALNWQNPARVMYDELAQQKANLQSELEASRALNTKLTADVDKLMADADSDGVSDYFDKCPGTAAGTKVDGSGCELPKDTMPKQVITKVTITEDDRRLIKDAIQNLEFEFAKSSIKASSYPSLDRVAEMLRTKGFSLKLGGHTDNVGNATKNMALSKDRAESVKQYLVEHGANPSKIEAVGYGANQPIASNKTAAGRQKNRRVEFTIY
ncbi:OmpA family protein [Chitinophaga pinensis]|uniref:OmpA/MotB domain protein n=1 Tax=Chitinophaga pinensis (strain ATCC 43595 / DSM 2588 / LMG 13176 / NBRC 15968 / NCIMB 11800 / UQM 2034) TaxID=485918 RepID=A0A979GAW0_CHIPD|nr:OmpA family protein [Chitinophaga pinensis]ACU63835.1 OmpA/MotB domain protein [Chitinophaga pinensis DSM 2588]